MRNTPYAEERARASLSLEQSECRIERLFVKKERKEEIRFSWWKEGRMLPRPLDLPEKDLLSLLALGMKNDVFSDEFLAGLRDSVNVHLRGVD